MNTTDIIKEAKTRLAEIEAEAVKLRAMIAAAEGHPVPLPASNPPPIVWVNPPPLPYQPYEPNIPWPFDRVTCVTGTIDPRGTQIIVGGPQRMDPNVRFAS